MKQFFTNSIRVEFVGGRNVRISKTHTPGEALTIEFADIADVERAMYLARAYLGAPEYQHPKAT